MTLVPDLDAYIPLRDAIVEYRTSDDTLFRLIRLGILTRHKRPSDRRTWLLREQLDAHFGMPKPVDKHDA
jgi:hypothetical protein